MQDVLQFAVIGVGIGGVYGLLAMGLIVIYRGAGVLNLAHGAMAMSSGYIFYDLLMRGIPVWGAFAIAVAAMAAFGVAVHWLVMRPLRSATAIAKLIATLGILVILQQTVLLWFGARPVLMSPYLPNEPLSLGGEVTIGRDRVIVVAIAIAVCLALWTLYKYTTFGKITSASVENQVLIAIRGWSPDLIASVNWAIGGALAAIAGCLIVPLSGLQPSSTSLIILPALAAALVAGFASFPLTLIAAFALGVLESEMTFYVSIQGAARSLPFVVVALIMFLAGRSIPERGFRFERLPTIDLGRLRILTILGGLVAFLAVAWALFDRQWTDAFLTMMVTAIVLLSLVVLTGYAGQLSLAQFAFAGIGALIAGRFAENGVPFLLALALGVVLTVPVGLLFALPALRTRGVNLAVITFGLGLATWLVVFNNPKYSGGTSGVDVGDRDVFGIDIGTAVSSTRYLTVVAVFLAVAILLVRNLRRDRIGRRMIAVRSSERAAASLGIHVAGTKLFAFGVATAIAALGGVLMSFRSSSVVVSDYSPFASINAVLLAVIGGIGFVGGPLVGMTLTPGGIGTLITDQIPGIENFIGLISGFVVLITLLSHPDGVAATISKVNQHLRARKPSRAVATHNAARESTETLDVQRVRIGSLHVEDVSVRFGGIAALDSVSLSVNSGEIVGLIGPNGAGKTTLVDVVTGFTQPNSGHVFLDDQVITTWSATARARAGLRRSFQAAELIEELTVRENLLVATDIFRVSDYVSGTLRPSGFNLPSGVRALATEFDLEDALDRMPGDLSFGQRRLVSIVRTIASDPSVLLLDEPASGLSRSERSELSHLLTDLSSSRGMAVLLIEHDVALVLDVADRVIVLAEGRILASGTPDEIRNNKAVIDVYLGTPHRDPDDELVLP
jgi:sulfate-transporting ATPase